MRINYVLIDLESVQPDALDLLAHQHFRLLVFVGANQAKVSFGMAVAVQKLGTQAQYIKISGNGPNALDFHIAYYIGRLATADPTAYFHIVSKDTGFDPLIQHLKSQKVFADRVKDVADIPLVRASNTKSPGEKVEVVLAKLKLLKASKPRTVKTLSSTIASLFQKQMSDEEVSAVVQDLVQQGHLALDGTKVTYLLAGDD
jgi:hypothetical protein